MSEESIGKIDLGRWVQKNRLNQDVTSTQRARFQFEQDRRAGTFQGKVVRISKEGEASVEKPRELSKAELSKLTKKIQAPEDRRKKLGVKARKRFIKQLKKIAYKRVRLARVRFGSGKRMTVRLAPMERRNVFLGRDER